MSSRSDLLTVTPIRARLMNGTIQTLVGVKYLDGWKKLFLSRPSVRDCDTDRWRIRGAGGPDPSAAVQAFTASIPF